MSKQPPPAPTTSAVGPCPTIIQISRTPPVPGFTSNSIGREALMLFNSVFRVGLLVVRI